MKTLPTLEVPKDNSDPGMITRAGRNLIHIALEKLGDIQWVVVQRMEGYAPLIQDVLGINKRKK